MYGQPNIKIKSLVANDKTELEILTFRAY